uniref:Uncharacterized protein n=1 Tax=Biomphalaria glabrata TaxID=6526 RepID=A0A2C9KFR0_BIOGL
MKLQEQVLDWDSIQFPAHPMRPKTVNWIHGQRPEGNYSYGNLDWPKKIGQDVASRWTIQDTLSRFGDNRDSSGRTLEQTEREGELRRSYSELASQIAYRYPNPGLPRAREGAMGGTWRHIKEVQAFTGSRLCFIDGLVSLYDQEDFNVNPPLSARRALQPPYAPTQQEYAASKQVPVIDNDNQRKIRLAPNPKRKGHYRYC